MKHPVLHIALCLMFVSFKAFSQIENNAGNKKPVLHSEQKKTGEPVQNVDTQNHMLLYTGELKNGKLYIKLLKSDHSIKATLLDKNQKPVWEFPVSSEQITISASKDFFVVASNFYNPYRLHEDGRIQLKGFTCYDAEGKILCSVTNTAFIAQVFITDNSQVILLSENGLESYNLRGERTWNFDSQFAAAEQDGGMAYIKTMEGNLSDNKFRLNLIDARNGHVVQSWGYDYGNELRLMHVNTEMNWLLMTVENGSDWSLNLVDMKTWQVITTVHGLQSGIFSPVWNSKDQTYGFLFYKGANHKTALPALGILDCKNFSFEFLSVGVQKLDLNNDQLTLLPEENLYSFRTVDSVKNYTLK